MIYGYFRFLDSPHLHRQSHGVHHIGRWDHWMLMVNFNGSKLFEVLLWVWFQLEDTHDLLKNTVLVNVRVFHKVIFNFTRFFQKRFLETFYKIPNSSSLFISWIGVICSNYENKPFLTLNKISSAKFCQHKLWPILYCEFDRPTFQSCGSSWQRRMCDTFLHWFEVLKKGLKSKTSNTASFHPLPGTCVAMFGFLKMNATLWMYHRTLHFFCWLQCVHFTTTSHL